MLGRNVRVSSIAVGVLVLLGAFAAHAEREGAALETIVVTGTRLPASEPIAATTAIDAATIETRNDPSVAELLTAVPGLYVESAGGRGTVGSVFIRGGEANFTQVFIDGVEVNDPTNTRGGSFDFTGLDVDEIARVEVVRGPLSSIYGSDALAGVIQIFTGPSSTERSWRASYDTGGADLWRASLGAGGSFAAASRYHVNATAERDVRDDSAYRGRALDAGLVFAPGPSLTAELDARHGESHASAFPDASGGPLFAALSDQDRRDASDDSLGFKLTGRRPGKGWQWHLDAALLDHDGETVSAGIPPGVLDGVPPSADDTRFVRERLAMFATTAPERRWQAAFGMDWKHESGRSRGSVSFAPGFDVPTSYDISRDTTGAFAEVTASAGRRLALSAALRRDDNEPTGARTTGQLAARYRLSASGVSLRASWGEGFKLPSLFSLGHPLVGNPALKPERARSFEVALESAPASDALEWQLAAFEQHFRDLIDFDFDTFMAVNRSRVDVSGLELELGFAAANWDFSADATALDVRVLGTSQPLNQRPERLASASVGRRLTRALELFAAWRYVGARYDSSIPTGEQRLGSFERWDLSLSWAASPALKVSFALDNALDRRYQTSIGFPDPGRVLRVGVRYRSR